MATAKSVVILLIALLAVQGLLNKTVDVQAVNVAVLDPETLQDSYGNKADRDSNVSFVDVKDSYPYKSDGKTASDVGAIGLLYDLYNSISDTSLPGGFPFDWVMKIKDGKFDLANDWKKIATAYLGYIIALGVGIVFILVFPIVGMCFCCCRCCGNCGGSRVIKAKSDAGHGDKCGRWTAIGIVTAFTTMALIGSILMFVTNSNISSSLKKFHDEDIDKIDDIEGFLNSIVQQAEQFVQSSYNFTLEVLFRDLDNIGYLLGIPIREHVLVNTGLGKTYDNIEELEKDARILKSNLEIIQINRQSVVDNSKLFHNFTLMMNDTVTNMSSKYSTFNANVHYKNFTTAFNALQLPNETNKIIALDIFLKQGISSITAESKENLNDIPEKVHNQTLNQRNDLKNEVGTYTDKITGMIKDLQSMKDKALNGIDFVSNKELAKKYTGMAKDYDQYRWYGGLGLACIMTITGLLLALGILFGLFGGDALVNPVERGGLSNAGGNMLIAGVILTFTFGWLTMLVTTGLFAIAAPAEKFGCREVEDLRIFDEILDEYDLFGIGGKNESWLGNKVYSGKNVVLKMSELIDSCKKGKAAYTALKMEEANLFNLSDATNYKNKFSIEDKIEKTVISFDNINIATGPMTSFIEFLKQFNSNMEYNSYNKTFSIRPVEPSKQFLTSLKNYTTPTIPNATEKAQCDNLIKQFEDEISNTGKVLTTSIKNIQEALEKIYQTTNPPQGYTLEHRCDDLNSSLGDIQANLSTNAAKAFNDSVKEYEARLTKVLDKFTSFLDDGMKNKIGSCLPVWNMFSDVVLFGLCRSTIEALGGWGCSTGWTTFFYTMSIVAAVKLSKHFRKMKHPPAKIPNMVNEKVGQGKMHHFQNKVSHHDTPKSLHF